MTTVRNLPAGIYRVLKKTGMKLEHTAPYSPQQNPTERANRTVKTMIGQFIEGSQNTWDLLLPEITFAVNSSVSDTTGFSQAFLVMDESRDYREHVTTRLQETPAESTQPRKQERNNSPSYSKSQRITPLGRPQSRADIITYDIANGEPSWVCWFY